MVKKIEVAIIFKIISLSDELEQLIPIKLVIGKYKNGMFEDASDNVLYKYIEAADSDQLGYGMRNIYVPDLESDIGSDLRGLFNYSQQFRYYRYKNKPNIILVGEPDSELVRYNDIDSTDGKLKPIDIENKIKESVRGQDEAIRKIVTAIWTSINFPDMNKNNILVTGQNSIGKKMIFKKLSEILDIPLIIFPVSALFKDGGSITADSILAHIFCDSEGDNMRINDAIVILDGIDRLVFCDKEDVDLDDVIQEELIKVIRGIKRPLDNENPDSLVIDTSKTIFVGMGNFYDRKKVNAGFLEENTGIHKLVKYGMTRKLLSEFSTVIEMNDPTFEMIKDILLNSSESELKNVCNCLETMGVEVKNLEEVANIVASNVIKNKMGVSGITSVIYNVFENVFYVLANEKLVPSYLIIGPNILENSEDYRFEAKKKKVKVQTKRIKE